MLQEEGPTVVLESGMGGQALDWCLVRPGLSAYATVFSYDRAGLGWSAGAGVPRTAMDDAKRLYELLTKLRLRPPYLLVGHSYGGLIARWFASNYSKDVMGIVLVDAVPESRYLDDAFLNRERLRERKAGRRMMRFGFLLSPVGVPRLLKRHIGAKRIPEPYRAMVKARGSRNGAYEVVYKGFTSIVRTRS